MLISNPDIINSCRVCRTPNQDGDYQDLYLSSTQHDGNQLLSEAGILYEYLFNIHLNERHYYPQFLCNSCDLQMKLFKKLKDKAHKTLEFLENLYDGMDNDKEHIQELRDDYSALEIEKDNEAQECQESSQLYEENETNDYEGVINDSNDGYVTGDILSENQDIVLNEYQENTDFTDIKEVTEKESQINTAVGYDIETAAEPTHHLISSQETMSQVGLVFEETIDKDDYITEIYELLDESKIDSHSDNHGKLLLFDVHTDNNLEALSDIEYEVEEYMDEIGNDLNEQPTQHTISLKKRRLNKDCGRNTTSATKREYKCLACQLEFSNSQELKLHRTQHLNEKYRCDVCSKDLKSMTALEHHMKMHNRQPAFQCEICEKTFMQKVHYQYHMNRHNNVRNFKCDMCAKAFLSNTDLKVHLRGHTGERPYVCKICGKDYLMMEHLKTHLLTHTEQYFQCDICNNKFSTHKTLRLHVQTIHAEEPRFKCALCLKPFRRKHHLQSHMKLHEKNSNCVDTGFELVDDPDVINEMDSNTDDLAEQYTVDPGFIVLNDDNVC